MPDSASLRVLTFDAEPPDNIVTLDNSRPCTGGYLCACVRCELDRARRLRVGVRSSRQPWDTRKAA